MSSYAIRGYPQTMVVLLERNAGANVTWEVFDSKNNFIVGGSAIQNPAYPTEYNAVFTIPETAFVENDGSKYWINWLTEYGEVRDSFIVFAQGEPIPKSSVSIIMDGQPIQSILAVPFKAQSATAQLYAFSGKLLEQKTVGEDCYVQVGQSYKYDVKFMQPAQVKDTLGRPYIIMWTYVTLAGSGTEMYQVYTPHFRELKWINDAKTYLDLLRIDDIQSRLRITPEIMMPFVGLALDRINGIGTATNWNVITMPNNLDYALQMCLRHEYINARYIAEGLSTFEFQGASTQLTSDRTQVWQTKMDEIQSWLNDNLEKLKNNVIRAGSPGAIAFGRSPALNWSPTVQSMAGWWCGSGPRLVGY